MAGWKCLRCGTQTHRRPPHNVCLGCRSSRRGRNKIKPTARVKQKQTLKKTQQKCQHGSEAEGSSLAKAKTEDSPASKGERRRVTVKSAGQKPPAASASGQSDPYAHFEYILECQYLPQLKSRIGSWRAYLIMGHACRFLARMRVSKQQLPPVGKPAPAALLSVAATVAGLAEEDEIRQTIAKHMSGAVSREKFRAAESLLIMALPGVGDVC